MHDDDDVMLALLLRRIEKINKRLSHIESALHILPAVRFKFKAGQPLIEVTHMINIKDTQTLPISIEADDKFGNAGASLDNIPAWNLTDDTLGTLAVAADGMSAVLSPSGKLGAVSVQVSAQADGKPVLGSLDVTIIVGSAASLAVTPGTPVDGA